MSDRLAIIIAVETYQDPAIGPALHAESDASAFARALEAAGFARENQVVLLGSGATRTAIESRLRKLVRNPPRGEALFVFYAGHAFASDGQGFLSCYDTQSDDLSETSVPLHTLLDALRGAGCGRFALFLDPRSGLGEPMPVTELKAVFADKPLAACFTSCLPGEESRLSGSLKAGLWAHHVTEAFAGRAPRSLEGTLLTAASLQAHLELELPRALRATFREAPQQTATLIGTKGKFLLADLAGVLDQTQPVADPRLQPLKRGSLRNESHSRVKLLAGYRKFHRIPDRVNASAKKFVADLAAEDVKADVDQTYASIREKLGYKRRDVEGSADGNSGFVRTPDFEYSVSVNQADDDPTAVVWRREVSAIKNPEVVMSKPFQQVFGDVFETLVFEFIRPFDLEAWVDRIEEEMPAGVKLRCASDCSTCDVNLAGFTGIVRLHHNRVEITGRQMPGSKGLVEAFLQFQDLFAARRDLQQLPLLEDRR